MARLKVKLEGFDELFEQIKAAGGTVEQATNSCLQESAQIMQAELKAQMQSAGVESDLISAMPPPEITAEGNRYTAKVGYKMGTYDPDNLSDGFKVLFLNYGTPHRTMHGKVAPRGFVAKAKKKANPQIKKSQQATLKKILGDLSK